MEALTALFILILIVFGYYVWKGYKEPRKVVKSYVDSKTKTCPHCATEIPTKAKICPHCRKSPGLPLWAKIIVVFAFIGFLANMIAKFGTTPSPKSHAPDTTSVIELSDKFKKMSPAEHLEAAKKSMSNPKIALLHLAAIPKTSPEFAQVEILKQKIFKAEEARRQQEAEKRKKEKAQKAAAINALTKKYDKFEDTTWYFDKSTPQTNAVNNICLYIGKKGGDTWLRYKIRYRGDHWLFIQSYKIMIDGKTFDIVPSRVERDNYTYVWEWCDEPVNGAGLLLFTAIAYSKDAKIRYEGSTYRKDRTISQKEKNAIKNVLKAFDALRNP